MIQFKLIKEITFTILLILSLLSFVISTELSSKSNSNNVIKVVEDSSERIDNLPTIERRNNRINPLVKNKNRDNNNNNYSQRSLDSMKDFKFNAPSSPSTNPTTSSVNNKNNNKNKKLKQDENSLITAEESSNSNNKKFSSSTTKPIYVDPTIEDLSLLPLVLAITIDGNVHALKRDSGQWLWTLHDDNGSSSSSASTSSSSSSSTKKGTGLKREAERRLKAGGLGDTVGSALVKGVGRKRGKKIVSKFNRTSTSTTSRNKNSTTGLNYDEDKLSREEQDEEDEDEYPEEDEIYIIEPHSQGDIYLYTRPSSSSSSATGTLQKLPLSMTQLVSLSPFTFPSDTSRMFIGKKETKLVGVDLKTGRLVGVFGSSAGWCEWDEEFMGGGNGNGNGKGGEECEEEIEGRPEDLLYMARTEYHLSIYSKASSSLLQTLKYTTYSSSTLGTTLQSQWTRTPDARYLQPMHDGSLICFLSGIAGAEWTIAFEVPVISIFDVAIPTSGLDSTGIEKANPIMFQQPNPTQHDGIPLAFDRLQTLPESTYIGKINGELFAMSKEKFPLVAFAPMNGLEVSAMVNVGFQGKSEGEGVGCRGSDCLLGRHEVLLSGITPVDNTIDPPVSLLGIEAPPSASPSSSSSSAFNSNTDSEDSTPPALSAPPSSPTPASTKISPYAPNRSSILATVYSPVSKLSETNSTLLVVLLVGLLGYLYARKFWNLRIENKKSGKVVFVGESNGNVSDSKSEASSENDVKFNTSFIPTTSNLLANNLSTPLSPTTLSPAINLTSQLSPSNSTTTTTTTSSFTPSSSTNIGSLLLDPLSPKSTSSHFTSSLLPSPDLNLSSHSSPRSRSNSGTFSPLIPSTKELPPLPTILDLGSGVGGEGDDNDLDSGDETKIGDELSGTPRRKGRRRRGKKTKKGGIKLIEELNLDNDINDKELINITLGEIDTKEEVGTLSPSLEIVETIITTPVDPHLIGGLSVSETILGYGSHGTVVLKGEFQGRAVAVKRLLKDFVTIATHEVALLQESDDHPHVIRYFCKEQRDTFLYIALELCPASLYDLIDQPSAYPDLVRDLDPKKALRQITSGIRHLHKLKIVHRDIKPQNILVSTSKLGGVRMLISDFGLCKKLDMDESSFQQTVNHAAGSFGYRAPEVLRGQVDPNDASAVGTPSSNSTLDSRRNGSSSSGSITTTDPSMRLTRSIDIFSLGCIFYYVLTGGEHPFGGRYEREMNILKGNLCLDRLDGLGEEALEVQDLITRMVATDPRERPSADSVLLHPFFWNAQKRLLFICDASDRFEIMDRDPPTPTLVTLEEKSLFVVGEDWHKSIDRFLIDNLGKYRKYDGRSVRDLLRVLRNKKHHYQDLPDQVRNHLGDLPGGFLSYFTTRFPHLLLHVYDTVSLHLSDEAMFSSTFHIPDDEQ